MKQEAVSRLVRSTDEAKVIVMLALFSYFMLQSVMTWFENPYNLNFDISFLVNIALAIWFGWFGISYYFLLNPQLIHGRQTKLALHDRPKYLQKSTKCEEYIYGESPPFLISHRGGSLDAPENTMQSFQFSVRNGVDMIESDVRITKDGHIIVCHDDTFERICKQGPKAGRTVRETNFDDLPELADEMPICFSDGSIKYKR